MSPSIPCWHENSSGIWLSCQDYTPQAWNGIVYYEKARSAAARVATPPPIQPSAATSKAAPALPIVTVAAGKLATTVVRGNGQAGNMVEIEEHCSAVL